MGNRIKFHKIFSKSGNTNKEQRFCREPTYLSYLSPLTKRVGEISVPLCQHVTLYKGHLNIICMGSPLNKAFYGWLLATLKSGMYQYFGNALTWHTGPHNKSWRGIKESIWSLSLSPLCDKVQYHLLWANTIYLILQYKMTLHTHPNQPLSIFWEIFTFITLSQHFNGERTPLRWPWGTFYCILLIKTPSN